MRLFFGLFVALTLAGCGSSNTSLSTNSRTTSSTNPQTEGYCAEAPVRTEALDNPSKHAWDLFLTLNHPAKEKTVARGEPDCSKRIGTPGTTAVWETWRNAATEVYLSNGAEPPEWKDTSLPDEKPGTVPSKPVDDLGHDIQSFHNLRDVSNRQKSPSPHGPFFSPEGIFTGTGGFGETRLNKATYDFIRNECLFSRQGQQRYAKAVADGKKPPIKFPVESIEVKAAWLDFEREKIPQEKWGTYYTVEYTAKFTPEGVPIPEGEQKKKKYGLVALHIITKDMPNWFWASFHHKDTPSNPYEGGDAYGQPKVLAGTVWENYRLGGTQTDFVQPTGGATILSDHYVEFGFQRSSCITCHASATISPTSGMPAAQPKAVCSMTPNLPDIGLPVAACKKIIGDDAFKPGTDELRIERGIPDPSWFQKDGKPYYLQTDFVWSIPFRGRDEAGPPPARCIW
jgi:hypothetical protein